MYFPHFVFVGKMQDFRELVNKTSKKLAGRGNKKDVHSVSNLIAGATGGTPSTPVVDLSGEEHVGGGAMESSKRKRMETSDKGVSSPVCVVLLRFKGDLFPLPNVWSEPDRYGPATTFYLSDLELKVIQDLGTAGWSRAMTEGIIAALKALKIAVVVNNSSTEGEVMTEVLGKERDILLAKVSKMEEDATKANKDSDARVVELKKQLEEA